MRSALIPTLGALSVFVAGPVWASETFKDWTLKCGAEVGALPTARTTPECVLDQTATNGTITVRAIVGGFTASGAPGVMFDISPPVLESGGLGLKVDGRILGASWIDECTATSCKSEVLLDAQFLRTFKRGRTATVRVRDQDDRAQAIQVSLLGFTAGFNRLGFK